MHGSITVRETTNILEPTGTRRSTLCPGAGRAPPDEATGADRQGASPGVGTKVRAP